MARKLAAHEKIATSLLEVDELPGVANTLLLTSILQMPVPIVTVAQAADEKIIRNQNHSLRTTIGRVISLFVLALNFVSALVKLQVGKCLDDIQSLYVSLWICPES
mmetsp:Transcript_24473/g.35088  ORF Transcript_24473/g.35088 Transcript_24473/m.35088 type:complete len:106 (+) Transcript_24473:17-334(+)